MQIPFIESLTVGTSIKFDKNMIHVNAGGQEQRIVPHQSPVREFSLNSKSLTPDQVTELYELFNTVEGRNGIFEYVDKSDYLATAEPKNLGDGASTQGVVLQVGDTHRLCKKYTCGSNVHYRPIYNATDLVIAGFPGATVEPGGIVTGLGAGNYTADFSFTTPVRFSQDTIDAVIQTKRNFVLYSTELVFVEQFFEPIFSITDTFSAFSGASFVIDFLFRSTKSQVYGNQTTDLSSGYRVIKNWQSTPMTEINFGERSAISQIDLEYLQAFWLNVKGSGAFWAFLDVDDSSVFASFRSGGFSYTLASPDPVEYSVKLPSARLFYEGTATDPGRNGWTGPVLNLCDCSLIFNSDETELLGAFTGHDRPVAIGDHVCNPVEAIAAKAIERTSSLDPNNLSVQGTQGQIGPVALLGGRLNDAKIITLKGVNWASPPASIASHPNERKQVGRLGEVTIDGQSTWAIQEVSEVQRLLNQAPIKATTPICTHRFCDAGCGLDRAERTWPGGVITQVFNQAHFTINDPDINLDFGTITFTSGPNKGAVFTISEGGGREIKLMEIPAGVVSVGDVVTIFNGCNKTPEDCKERHGNFINFSGIPSGGKWVPGNEKYQSPGIVR